MIDREREIQSLEKQQRRHPIRRAADVVGEVFISARERALPPRYPEATYAFPDRQKNLTKYYSPDFFAPFPNPAGLNLYRIAQERVAKARQNGTAAYDAARDTRKYKSGRAIVRTEHAGDLAKPGFLNFDERSYRAAGFEVLFSEILKGGHLEQDEPVFKHVAYGDSEPVELFREDGSSILLHELFGPQGPFPNPIPEGSVVRFFDGEYVLEATVLPVGKEKDEEGRITDVDNIIPQLCLIGPAEKSNLDVVMTRARKRGGRILVVYKEGHEGLAGAFVQPDPGYTDVYELLDEDKKKVKRVNGQLPRSRSLPAIRPGNLQVVLMPIKGKIETTVRGETDAPSILLTATVAVYGIDVVEKGTGTASERLVPIRFKKDRVYEGEQVDPNTLLAWQKRGKENRHDPLFLQFLDYVRANAIMPVQPVMISVRRKIEFSHNGLSDGHGLVFDAQSLTGGIGRTGLPVRGH